MRAATRVNAEQASKRSMCRPTRLQFRGRLIRLGEMSEDDAQSLHRGTGGSTYTIGSQTPRQFTPRAGRLTIVAFSSPCGAGKDFEASDAAKGRLRGSDTSCSRHDNVTKPS